MYLLGNGELLLIRVLFRKTQEVWVTQGAPCVRIFPKACLNNN